MLVKILQLYLIKLINHLSLQTSPVIIISRFINSFN